MAASVEPRYHQGKLVCFCAGIREEHNLQGIMRESHESALNSDRQKKAMCSNLEISWQLGGQRLGEVRDYMIQVDDGGMLQSLRLVNNGVDNVRVAVAAGHSGYPSKSVEVAAAMLVEQVLHLAVDNVQL